MSTDDILPILLLFLGALVAYVAGLMSATDVTQKDAIDNNAAHWEIDPKTGEKSFVWNKPNNQPPPDHEQ